MHGKVRPLVLLGLPTAAAFLIGVVTATPALAWSRIPGQPGSACVANSGLKYDNLLGAGNDTSAAVTALCPVVYDADDLFNNPSQMLWVNVYDRNGGSGQDVKCTVYGTNEYGQVGFTSPTQKTTGSSTSSYLFEFGLDNFLGYNLSCSLPAKSGSNQSRVTNYGLNPVD